MGHQLDCCAGSGKLPPIQTPPPLPMTGIIQAHPEYDNLGPICDLSLDSIAAGNMRLLRHKRDKKLYAGKVIPRPKVSVLCYCTSKGAALNHRIWHGSLDLLACVCKRMSAIPRLRTAMPDLYAIRHQRPLMCLYLEDMITRLASSIV